MSTNVTHEYQDAEKSYLQAKSLEDKIKYLQEMLRTCPKHKGSEKLQKELKERLKRYKQLIEKEKQQRKGKQQGIKKEGAATVVIVGVKNSGKSTLLNKLTDSKVNIGVYTKKPEIGVMDYKGIKVQVIEVPAIVENFEDSKNGLYFLSIIRLADLIIVMPKDKNLVLRELQDINVKKIEYNENIKEDIWNNLGLIKIFTKQPGKKPSYPPVALKKGSKIKDLAGYIHKDFLKKFSFARIWGKSAKFPSQAVGLQHNLEDDDIVEIHMK